ncbi:putative transferase CAF17, mitochondrial [Drosophila hydei]|uniref:Transferase CAF17, mitochondrial n=1 Tax=Drosophila hydei TaxID=7224 RepID=A0A6J1LPT7_DROHY|nr:putative transferase CAF17, mitochondrial [Drosophila hydei]
MNVCKNFKYIRVARDCLRNFTGRVTTPKSLSNTFIFEPLQQRELIRVHGAEVVPFLQGLVTNDVSRMEEPNGPSSMYALFLNRSGRLLYDTIIYRTNDPDTFLLECDRDASSDVRRHLRTYRVRKRIEIDTIDDEYIPWVMFNKNGNGNVQVRTTKDLFISPDPRIHTMGTRVLVPGDINVNKLTKDLWCNHDAVAIGATPECNYKLLRYRQGIGEGVKELPPGKCFPLEANADYLNGVSFSKGCYVGQELTARIHHSGVIRKRYMPIRFTAPITNQFTVKSAAGANVGRVFGHAHKHGVALLRIQPVLNSEQELMVDGDRCYVDRPQWWPKEEGFKRSFAVD